MCARSLERPLGQSRSTRIRYPSSLSAGSDACFSDLPMMH